jgi:hypothetical protein
MGDDGLHQALKFGNEGALVEAALIGFRRCASCEAPI